MLMFASPIYVDRVLALTPASIINEAAVSRHSWSLMRLGRPFSPAAQRPPHTLLTRGDCLSTPSTRGERQDERAEAAQTDELGQGGRRLAQGRLHPSSAVEGLITRRPRPRWPLVTHGHGHQSLLGGTGARRVRRSPVARFPRSGRRQSLVSRAVARRRRCRTP